ncbi:50S ribosomal protein L23 [Candidatus Parcubacteria bacterium]|nr:50S ribosomal protein L23 [Candidatus Parcubacteria bacterium]
MKDLYRDKAKPGKTSQKKVEGKEAKKETKKKAGSSRAYRVLIKPLITEKAAILNTESKYVFSVATNANKIEIANAVEEVYGIKPIAVNIIKVSGKKVRYGRTFGKRKNWKKAIVALPKGKSINIYEGV